MCATLFRNRGRHTGHCTDLICGWQIQILRISGDLTPSLEMCEAYPIYIYLVPVPSRKPRGSRWLVKWVHKPQLIWWKCFPDDKLEWLVSETQHYPIYVHLQAATYGWGWLISWIMFSEYKLSHSLISRVASWRGLTVTPSKSLIVAIWILTAKGYLFVSPMYRYSYCEFARWVTTLNIYLRTYYDFNLFIVRPCQPEMKVYVIDNQNHDHP